MSRYLLALSVLFLQQCISPGLVETEFAYRLFSENPEKAAATYKSIKV